MVCTPNSAYPINPLFYLDRKFPQSCGYYPNIEESISPVIAEEDYKDSDLFVKKGDVLGVLQVGTAYKEGDVVIKLTFKASLGEKNPIDSASIKGVPDISFQFNMPVQGDIATAAVTANTVPVIKHAKSGLITMADIPTLSCHQ